jgi:hypothetical protein
MLYQRSAAERSAPTFLVPDETFSQFQGTLAAEVHSESFVVHEILKLPERENPGLQLQARQHVVVPHFRAFSLRSKIPCRSARTWRRVLGATSLLFLSREPILVSHYAPLDASL